MYRAIVVGTDGSDRAARVVEHAAGLAAATGAELHVVSAVRVITRVSRQAHSLDSVVDETAVDQALAARHRDVDVLADQFRSRGIATTVHIHCGDPNDVILKTAESVGADLVVVGNRGLTGPRRLLGSVPTHVARAAAAAVLIVRSS